MEIIPMLMRLEHALDCPDLAKQMVLLPKMQESSLLNQNNDNSTINLVVGYNGSPRSQTALDLTLWIAHQTRLATRKAVTVQVVYVIESISDRPSYSTHWADSHNELNLISLDAHLDSNAASCASDVGTLIEVGAPSTISSPSDSPTQWVTVSPPASLDRQIQQFEKADHILWQARHLAEEWRGSLETHLRFGSVSQELCAIANRVTTTALVLGCSSAKHPIVKDLASNLPFPVLGVPREVPIH